MATSSTSGTIKTGSGFNTNSMRRLPDFEDFLEEKCEASGGFEGVLDDDYPDAFEHWLEYIEVPMVIQYGNEFGEFLEGEIEKRLKAQN